MNPSSLWSDWSHHERVPVVSNPSPVEPLLLVQERRVDQAMAAVTACNLRLREAQRKHDEAHASWVEAETQARAALDRRARVVAGHLGQALSPADLLGAVRSLEWSRACAAQRAVQLEAARAAMIQAEENANQARRVYRQADARRQALLNLAEEQRKADLQKSLRIQENEIEDRASAELAVRLMEIA